MTEVADRGTTVLMSSHLLSDLSDVCDHLLLLDKGRIQLAGDIDDVFAEHRLFVGPAVEEIRGTVVSGSHTERQTTLLVRGADGPPPSGWMVDEPDLETLVKGYLRASR
jgi:ABC-2 type transport system ATP-binding protein